MVSSDARFGVRRVDYADDAWKDLAACRGMIDPPELFFPGVGPSKSLLAEAKAVCQACPVRRPCLEAGLREIPTHDRGIWGGTTARERRKLKARRG